MSGQLDSLTLSPTSRPWAMGLMEKSHGPLWVSLYSGALEWSPLLLS